MSNDLLLPEVEVKTALDVARAFVIKSKEDYVIVDVHCSALLKLKKKIEDDFAESKATTYAAWKSVVAQEKGHLDGIDEARRIDKAKLVAWQEVEEKQRREDEVRCQQEAKKRADDEALERAREAHESGQHEQAEAIINTPVEVPVIVLPKDTPKTSTIIQTRWDFRVIDPAAVPREYLQLDITKVAQIVRAMKNETNIPGIQAFSKKV